MTTPTLLTILNALLESVDPCTGERITDPHSCLRRPSVQTALRRVVRQLEAGDRIDISDEIIQTTCADLRQLGYEPLVNQVAKIFIGSRSIADPRLRGLPVFKRYRGVFTRTIIRDHLLRFADRHPAVLAKQAPAPVRLSPADRAACDDVDFFRTGIFDQLTDEKYRELQKAITNLGLSRPTDVLPEYMQSSREIYARAYEPWTSEEQALLVEAMCYTNHLGRLRRLFGRSGNAVEKMGQRLIFESKRREAVG